jgi:hypothetical protein
MKLDGFPTPLLHDLPQHHHLHNSMPLDDLRQNFQAHMYTPIYRKTRAKLPGSKASFLIAKDILTFITITA